MKTIKDYEEEFDDKFHTMNVYIPDDVKQIKNYIFQELLPQVLSEIIDIDDDWIEKDSGLGRVIKEKLKQKAKEMGINLPE